MESKYPKKLNVIIGNEKEVYKTKWIKRTKKRLETMAKFRMRSETETAK